jgi:hypothetical protein
MYSRLIAQHLKKTWRSSFFRQNWGIKILLGFVGIYFLSAFSLLGFFTKEILESAYPDEELLSPVFMSFALYYFLSDLVVRFMLQDLKVLSIQHYLILPIRKNKLVHFLLQSSLFNFFNLLALLLIVPFGIRVVFAEYGSIGFSFWLISILALISFNHFLAIYLKRILAVDFRIFIAAALIISSLFILTYLELIDLEGISQTLLSPLAASNWAWLIPIGLLVGVYQLNYQFLLKMTYLDRWKTKSDEARTGNFGFLERRGAIGFLVANELKLIFRHKRTKTAAVFGFILVLYGLIFYPIDTYNQGYGWLLFVGIFVTGAFMINYGQFIVSWESAYFDGILTRAFNVEDYFKAKLFLLIASSVLLYLLSMGYLYFGIKALYINTAAFLYNIGVNSFVLLFASTYNRKPIDLSKGSAFNYQGTSATQFVIIIPLMVVPFVLFQAFNVFNRPIWGLIAIGALGLIGLLFHRYLIKAVVQNFFEKKYRNAEGYRQGDS